MTASIGERLPEFEYRRPDGSTGLLSDFWAQGPAVFVWLRQCGCIFFHEALAQLREVRPRFRERGIRLVLIVQVPPERLLATCGAEVECISDPDKVTHRAMGLGKARFSSLFLNADLRRRRKEAARAGFRQDWKRTFAAESDVWLLPGVALVGRGGRILWLFRGEHTGDLPSAEMLLAVASEHCVTVRS